MKTSLIDSHAHLSSDELFFMSDELLQRAQVAGVSHVINICTNESAFKRGKEIRNKYPWVYNTASTTPHDVELEGEKLFPLFADAAKNGEIVAVGETGLDYHYNHSPKELQKEFLRRYLHLAWENNLPLIFHCREAFHDLFGICEKEFGKKMGFKAVLHCFTGSLEEAEEVIQRGWYLSLSGIVTFKKSDELREVAKMVPLDQLLIETDSPYLAPQSKRGKVNEPAYIKEVAEMVAQCKQISFEEVARATSENAKRLFSLD